MFGLSPGLEGINDYASIKLFFKGVLRMVGTSMPCTETIDGWIPGIDAQPRTPKEEINAPLLKGFLRVIHGFLLLLLDPENHL